MNTTLSLDNNIIDVTGTCGAITNVDAEYMCVPDNIICKKLTK